MNVTNELFLHHTLKWQIFKSDSVYFLFGTIRLMSVRCLWFSFKIGDFKRDCWLNQHSFSWPLSLFLKNGTYSNLYLYILKTTVTLFYALVFVLTLNPITCIKLKIKWYCSIHAPFSNSPNFVLMHSFSCTLPYSWV